MADGRNSNTYTVYSADGFQSFGTFASLHAAQESIREQAYGTFTIESPRGQLWSVAAGGWAPKARLDADRTARPLTAIKQYRNVSVSGRVSPPSPYRTSSGGGRNGTNHTHPPGRTRCPKCGV